MQSKGSGRARPGGLSETSRDKAFNHTAEMLGGKPRSKAKGWSLNKSVLNAVLDFAEASRRFTSRAPARPQNRDQGQREHPGLNPYLQI